MKPVPQTTIPTTRSFVPFCESSNDSMALFLTARTCSRQIQTRHGVGWQSCHECNKVKTKTPPHSCKYIRFKTQGLTLSLMSIYCLNTVDDESENHLSDDHLLSNWISEHNGEITEHTNALFNVQMKWGLKANLYLGTESATQVQCWCSVRENYSYLHHMHFSWFLVFILILKHL